MVVMREFFDVVSVIFNEVKICFKEDNFGNENVEFNNNNNNILRILNWFKVSVV